MTPDRPDWVTVFGPEAWAKAWRMADPDSDELSAFLDALYDQGALVAEKQAYHPTQMTSTKDGQFVKLLPWRAEQRVVSVWRPIPEKQT